MSSNNIGEETNGAAIVGANDAAAFPQRSGNGQDHVVLGEQAALDTAHRVAEVIKASAALRERERDIPSSEMEL